MPTNAYFFRRRVFQENGSFNTNFAICADRELLIRYKLAGVPTLPVRRVLYRYLAHEGSTTLNAERRPVRYVAGGEQQGRFLAVQRRQLALQQHVVVVGAGNVAGAAGAGAAAVDRLVHGEIGRSHVWTPDT